MSIRPEAQLPFDRSEWFTLARSRLRWAANTRVDKLCGHTFCDLTQPRCCACIDARAERTRYFRYVDGRGMVADAKRWHDYCPGCKIHHRTEQEAEDNAPNGSRGENAGGDGEAIVCATCGERGHAMWDCPRGVLDEESVSTHDSSGSEASVGPPEHRLPVHAASGRHDPQAAPLRFQHCPYLPPWERYSPPRNQSTETHTPQSPEISSPSRGISLTSPTSRLTIHQARRQRVREHFERSFGSLADIANDPDYVSPIASLYGNAYARFQERERERRERLERQANNSEETNNESPSFQDRYLEYLERQRLRNELERIRSPPTRSPAHSPPRTRRESNTQQVLEALRRQLAEDDRQLLATSSDSDEQPTPAREEVSQPPSIFGRWYDMHMDPPVLPLPVHSSRRRYVEPPRPKTPEALSKEELMISNECKVCFSQHCDMLLMPCAHLALCEWCAKKTYPEVNVRRVHNQCVICRGRVNKMIKIYRS